MPSLQSAFLRLDPTSLQALQAFQAFAPIAGCVPALCVCMLGASLQGGQHCSGAGAACCRQQLLQARADGTLPM